jgi:CheY-like chemotaxis protein
VRERRPDLVLLDLHLPGIPGEEVLRQISWSAAEGSGTRQLFAARYALALGTAFIRTRKSLSTNDIQ